LTKAKVLLVEDDPIQVETTKEILQNVGYDVSVHMTASAPSSL
jgi:CheY-like chemotaxis protein